MPEAPDPYPALLRVELIPHAKRNYHERANGGAYLAVLLRPAIRVPQPHSGRAGGRKEYVAEKSNHVGVFVAV